MTGVYDVVVIGAGIAGLAAAHALANADDVRVTVLEAAPVVGGKLRVSQIAGLSVDEGAEQVLVRPADGLDLIRAVGLGDEIVHPATTGAGLWTRGRLRPLPGGTVLGVPADPLAVARAGVLSPGGLARAAADAVLPRTPVGADISVGAYVRARVGREVVDRLVDPLLGGVYAGQADELSLAATVPQLDAHIRRHRTLLGAARAARTTTAADGGPIFATVRGGLGRLPEAVVASMPATVRTSATVRGLARSARGYRVIVGDTRVGEEMEADAVILAVPARRAARLLSGVAPAAAGVVGVLDYASVAVVTLAYRRVDVPALHGTGFLVPAVERRVTKAVTYTSAKWSHLNDVDVVVFRGSVGRYGDAQVLQRDDADLVTAVAADLAAATGLTAAPVASRVSRWGGGLPQYAPGHLNRVRLIRSALPARLVVCGAAYDGVGIPACVRSGREAATAVLDVLRQSRGDRQEEGT
jgi:oxygen-dependent protoporphyrinogen oxidase